MAQRQYMGRAIKQIWTCLNLSKCVSKIQAPLIGSRTLLDSSIKAEASFSIKPSVLKKSVSPNYITQATQEKSKNFIDLFTNNVHKQLYMPTISINTLKVYEDVALPKFITDPVINNMKIIDAPVPGRPEKKEAVRMILIRRRKMRKHKLRKLRKRMKFVFAKRKLRRELRKAQAFRTELLSQVEEADNFDAKVYVENIINTIRNQPKEETMAEMLERHRLRKKANKWNTTFIRPNFDD